MAITDNKITSAEVAQNPVQGVIGDRLTGTVQQNKAVFDKLGELIVYHFNVLVDDVDSMNGTLTGVVTGIGQINNAEISAEVEAIYEDLGWENPNAENVG